MKVFLTGGTGFIGQPLTRTLMQRGSERDLGMRYRSLEQAWLDTLEGERAIAHKS